MGKTLPPGVPIGESWEVSGYGADMSVVGSGNTRGATLAHLALSAGARLLGASVGAGPFPLLVKFIDAQDKLSIQVHPTDEQAVRHGWDRRGKTECWYIVHTRPDAEVIVGFKQQVSGKDLEDAVRADRLHELLNRVPIQAGDMLFIPAGTVHAILEGTLLYEVQESSDSTLRLYDWGRTDASGRQRELHVEASLKVLDTTPHECHKIPPLAVERSQDVVRRMRVACRYFAIEEYLFAAVAAMTLPQRASFHVLSVMSGIVNVERAASRWPVRKGQTVMVPADMTNVRLVGVPNARAVVSWVPNLAQEVIAPLQAAGYSREEIALLGGFEKFNDILPLL